MAKRQQDQSLREERPKVGAAITMLASGKAMGQLSSGQTNKSLHVPSSFQQF